MTTLILIPLTILFAIGAKASLENERGQIDWLLQIGMSRVAIVVLFFVFAPWVVWNGCLWCVWRVKTWWAMRKAKRRMRRAFEEIAENHKDDAELQEDLKDLMDEINKL